MKDMESSIVGGGRWSPTSWGPEVRARLFNGEQDFKWPRQARQAAQGGEMALAEAQTGKV